MFNRSLSGPLATAKPPDDEPHRKRCLRRKGSDYGGGDVAVVGVVVVKVCWEVFGPSCDRGNVGNGSSLSSCQLLRPPQLSSQLAFAREPERGAGGGVDGGGGNRRSRCWLLVLCINGSGLKRFLPPKTVFSRLGFRSATRYPATAPPRPSPDLAAAAARKEG